MTLQEINERWPLFRVEQNGEMFIINLDLKKVNTSKYHVKNFDKPTIEYLEHQYKTLVQIKYLSELFPNLYFSPFGLWIVKKYKMRDGSVESLDGAAVKTNFKFWEPDLELLKVLNQKADKAVNDSKNYFWCSEHEQSMPWVDYGGFFWTAQYCSECCNKPSIKAALKEASQPGYYD